MASNISRQRFSPPSKAILAGAWVDVVLKFDASHRIAPEGPIKSKGGEEGVRGEV